MVAIIFAGLIFWFQNGTDSINLKKESADQFYGHVITIGTFLTGFSFVAFEILISSTKNAATMFVSSGYFARFKTVVRIAVLSGVAATLLSLVPSVYVGLSECFVYFLVVVTLLILSILSAYNAHRISYLFLSGS